MTAPVLPMLATAGPAPAGPGWAREFKWDGMRVLAAVSGTRTTLHSRAGHNLTTTYPELTAINSNGHAVLLDGEVVALNERGAPDFERLQRRMHTIAPSPALIAQIPVAYYVFDILECDGRNLTRLSYQQRRDILDSLDLETRSPAVRLSPYFTDIDGDTLLDIARQHGIEGVVSKRLTSTYTLDHRTPLWVKTPLINTQEAIIGGWTPDGALLLGVPGGAHGKLHYVGHVRSGHATSPNLAPNEQLRSPFTDVPTRHTRCARWCHPDTVAEVTYTHITRHRRLRGLAWRGLRPDRIPAEVALPLA